MLAKIHSAVCDGVEGVPVTVETVVTSGLPYFNIVGLAATTVMEAKERIRAALIGSGLLYPRGRITVNLAPAGVRKNGSHLDLPIAVGVLASQFLVDKEAVGEYGILGELSLNGEVLRVDGILPMMLALSRCGIRKVIVPKENVKEASLAFASGVYGVSSLEECQAILSGKAGASGSKVYAPSFLPDAAPEDDVAKGMEFGEVYGQENAKRALVIAAAGGHGVLMVGSPGCGKSMLARRLPSILPAMTREEVISATILYSVMGQIDPARGVVTARPFRMPHHTIGRAGLLGGGLYPRPGEISLAHHGVLFLDEFCEFERDLMEALRIPMEDKEITHIRQGKAYRFPCDFLLVMAANPCPCGYLGDSERICRCSEADRERYRRRFSGPLMERIDIRVRMERVDYRTMSEGKKRGWTTVEMRETVERACAFAKADGRGNAPTDAEIRAACRLTEEGDAFLEEAYRALSLTPRTCLKTLRVARTIADLDASQGVEVAHLAEALSYRIGEEGSV